VRCPCVLHTRGFPSVTNTHFSNNQVLCIMKFTIQNLELAKQTEFSYAGCLPQSRGFLLLFERFSCFCESCSFCLLFKNPSLFDHAINEVKLSTLSAEPSQTLKPRHTAELNIFLVLSSLPCNPCRWEESHSS